MYYGCIGNRYSVCAPYFVCGAGHVWAVLLALRLWHQVNCDIWRVTITPEPGAYSALEAELAESTHPFGRSDSLSPTSFLTRSTGLPYVLWLDLYIPVILILMEPWRWSTTRSACKTPLLRVIPHVIPADRAEVAMPRMSQNGWVALFKETSMHQSIHQRDWFIISCLRPICYKISGREPFQALRGVGRW